MSLLQKRNFFRVLSGHCAAPCHFMQSQAFDGAVAIPTESTFLMTMTQQALHVVLVILHPAVHTQSLTTLLNLSKIEQRMYTHLNADGLLSPYLCVCILADGCGSSAA